MEKLNSSHIEIAIARFFNPRINIIVPNIHWGLGLHYECDLLIISQHNYATEIEIKTSKQDIKNEQKKHPYAHHSNMIKKFFFAVPENLIECEYLPKDCGLISINKKLICKTIRPPKINKLARKLTDKEIRKVLHLGCMRIWNLKEGINTQKEKNKE